MRDGTAVSGTIVEDINKAFQDVAPFLEAAKGESDEL